MPLVLVLVGGAIVLLLLVPLFNYNAEATFGPATRASILPTGGHPTWGDILNALGGQLRRFEGWLQQAVMPVVLATWSWVDSHTRFLNAVGVHAEAQQRLNLRITGTYIPGAVHHADAVGQQVYHDSVDYAGKAAGQASHHADQVGAAAEAYARALAVAEEGYAASLNAQTQQLARQLYRQSTAYAASLAAANSAEAQRLQAQALAYAQSVEVAVSQYAQQLLQQAQAFTTAEAQTLERYIESVQQADTSYTDSQVGAAVAPLAAAMAATQAAVSELEQSDCMKFCNPLGNLGAGLEAIDLAALLAFMVAVVRDPKGGSGLVSELLTPILGDIEGQARELLGIKAG